MRTNEEVVFHLWCRLTGREPGEVSEADRAGFLASPQVSELSATPYPTLLEAAISAASRGSMPLPVWLDDVRALRARHVAGPFGPAAGHPAHNCCCRLPVSRIGLAATRRRPDGARHTGPHRLRGRLCPSFRAGGRGFESANPT